MRKTIVASFLLLGLVCASRAQETFTDSLLFTIKPIGNNVFAAIAKPKSSAGSNSGFVIGDDGVAVIDTFQDDAAAKQLLAEIQKLTKLPVKFVVNHALPSRSRGRKRRVAETGGGSYRA